MDRSAFDGGSRFCKIGQCVKTGDRWTAVVFETCNQVHFTFLEIVDAKWGTLRGGSTRDRRGPPRCLVALSWVATGSEGTMKSCFEDRQA